jgi:two-component system, NarL family, sensor histidine kinase UhpB
MSSSAPEEAYRGALAAYLAHGGRAPLEHGVELGRAALARGNTLAQLVAQHRSALLAIAAADTGAADSLAALDFLGAALSPFAERERTQRDALSAWRHINARLEQEIRRVAHALHDESGQLLVSLHLQLAQLARDLPGAQAKIQDCQQLLHQAEQQLRHLSHELRPMVLDDLGWLAAIEFLAHAMSVRAHIPIEVQEALSNATRHARASRIRVEVDQEHNCLCGLISDDGVGFEAHSGGHGRGGLGLQGMQERLGALGGTLRVASAPGRGAEIRFRLPLES